MKKFFFLLLLLLPATARAQRQNCDLLGSGQLYSVGGGEVVYVGRPVFTCESGMRITADSAIVVKTTSRADFIGNVHFTENDRSLTSQYAQYLGTERKLQAQGNVVLTDRRDGSILRAPTLDYFQQTAANKEARIEIYSGRPHATLMRKRTNSNAVDTTNVDSDRMQLIGQNTFRGWGSVKVVRGKLNTQSGFAEFVQDSNRMKLTGQAVVISDTVTLKADTIDGTTVNGDQFKEMYARVNASLDTKNVKVQSPSLRVSFDKGNVTRLVAVGGQRTGPTAPQAKAQSEGFTLTADSIDARTPNQKLDTVAAVGGALAQRTVDSLDAKLPDLIKRDWVRGDTVRASFEDADTARVLKRIIARGAPASSTYRMREKDKSNPKNTKLSVNYITAKLIDVRFKKGDVEKVRAEGDIKGMYLQPPSKGQ